MLTARGRLRRIGVHRELAAAALQEGGTWNPSVVHQGSDGLWSYTIDVKENAGVNTRLTLLRIDGRDYSGNIADSFGTDLLQGRVDVRAVEIPRVVGAGDADD